MDNLVTIIGLSRATPAEYEAQWCGRPLRIVLDMSATLALLGSAHSSEKVEILGLKAEIVAKAAQRLIDLRIEKPQEFFGIVAISALDLDEGASKPAR